MERYAGHFEVSSKEGKELIVAREWLNSLPESSAYREESLRLVDDQWPDCEIETKSGGRVGIEITELVCPSAIKASDKGRPVIRYWTQAEVKEEIDRLIRKKDLKSHGGRYSKLVLIIHTDEWTVSEADVDQHVGVCTSNIDEAYVLFSYNPASKGYPLVRLDLA